MIKLLTWKTFYIMSSRNSLTYSTNALNVKSLFFNKNISIYVEGKEDILFWDNVFKPFSNYKYHIEETNGLEGLNNYIDKILNENAKIIVACDRDHSVFTKNKELEHPLIIKTYGHSIENTMYCVNNIENAIKRFSKTRKDFKSEIIEWYREFCHDCQVLLYYDIANKRFSKNTKVFGNKCNRLLENEHAIKLSNVKISRHISLIESNFKPKEIKECISLVKKDNRELRFLIKGHFLTNAVINYIKTTVYKETGTNVLISIDNLYSLMIGCIVSCKTKCEDKATLHKKAKKGIDYLKKIKPSA